MQDLVSDGNVFEKLFIKAYQEKQMEVVCLILWLLWYSRNRVIHDHLYQSAKEIGMRLKEYLDNCYVVPAQEVVFRQGRNDIQWLPPPMIFNGYHCQKVLLN